LVRKAGVIGLIVAAFVAVLVLMLPDRNVAVRPVSCRDLPVEGVVEDIRLNDRGVAYLATGSTILLVDLNIAEPRPRAALATEPGDFRPLAIALFGDRLFAVDRRDEDGPSQVVVFERTVTGAFASAGRPVRDEMLKSPEAISATGPNQFYVANEPAMFFSNPSVVYYDGEKMQPAEAAVPTRNTSVSYRNRTLVSTLVGTKRELLLCGP
jgi:hypothetical protein